ncbi:MAG: hypothetical protein EPN38_02070 [Rhodanobacteraceae bacterium]|nr:MAG: hypothetical protein EPN38_02070 [Rhodanobacteraceae bacterium]
MPRTDGLKFAVELQPAGAEATVARDVVAELPELPYVRLTQRVRPPPERRNPWLLLALVLAGHVLLAWLGYWIVRPMYAPVEDRGVIAVSLVAPTSNVPAPPPPLPPPPLTGQPAPAPPRRLHYVPPAKGAMSATLEGVKGPPLELYGANGEVRLPPGGSAPPAATPAYVTPGIQGSHITSGKSPVVYKPTRFAKDFEPANQNLAAKTIGRAFDKVVKKTTVVRTVHLPAGVKVHCAVSPLVLFAGCRGDAPQPPPRNDDDIRLSMPPPETLTGKKVLVPGAASSVAAPRTSG